MFDEDEYEYLAAARVGRLATADAAGRPHVVPICFAVHHDMVVSPLDEKPKTVDQLSLRRVRDIKVNPRIALVVDHWTEQWDALGWVQIRGTAELVDPGASGHEGAVSALRSKYAQYADHALERYPLIRIEPSRVVSWGDLTQ